MQGHYNLEEPCGPGGRLCMSNLAFDRTQGAIVPPVVALGVCHAKNEVETPQFGRISCYCSSAMRFYEPYSFRGITSLVIGPSQCFCLTRGKGGIDTIGASVRGGAQAFEHRIDGVAVLFCVIQALECNHANSFTKQSTVGVGREGATVTGLGESRSLAEAHVHENIIHCVSAAGDDHVGLAQEQFVHGHRNCAKTTCAGSVGYAIGST